MLTRAGLGCAAGAAALLMLGILWGNTHWLLVGSLPLFAVLLALGADGPGGIEVRAEPGAARVRVGDAVRVRVRVRAARGRGLLEVHCPVPEVFELLEGSNLHLLRKGRRALDESFEFTVRCTKRGSWALGAARWESIPLLGLRAGEQGAQPTAQVLEVVPRLRGLRRVRSLPGYAARIFPADDLARTGVQTTDFREIRSYAWGDPVHAINWKATARRLASAGPEAEAALPLVNEYEREGKKTVWIFLDCGAHMEVGSNAENAFEVALHAAGDLAKFYLDRGYSVGAYCYNARDQFLHAESGSRQFLRFSQLLTSLEPGAAEQGFRAAVERCRGVLARGRPLVVVVTRAAHDTDTLVAGVQRLRALAGRRRRRLPVVVVSPAAHPLLPAEDDLARDAARLLRRAERPALARLRVLGARVVEWDPRQHSFAAAMWGGRA